MRRLVIILLALLILLAGGVSARHFAAVAGPALPSESDAEDESASADPQDPACAQDPLVAFSPPSAPRARARFFLCLRTRAARPRALRGRARSLHDRNTPLRC